MTVCGGPTSCSCLWAIGSSRLGTSRAALSTRWGQVAKRAEVPPALCTAVAQGLGARPAHSKPLYLATVIDLCSRRLAGWAIADHMRTELVIDALATAQQTRRNLAGAVLKPGRSGAAHEHGSQYTSRAFAEICCSAGVRQSMGAVGSSANNAAAEWINAAFERETLKGRKGWLSESKARLDVFRWLARYNTRRRHSRLGRRSPVAYEIDFRATAIALARAA
ncbi:DDE-type integrase/transposase/recombinase [Streptomyces sp. NPDC060000]|uniref:DDE-type integrase/transposase/recombinase n=1 Tax=Streptomyces sp. NPDC060000 TaxID=3347031 RepID=UPI0036970171